MSLPLCEVDEGTTLAIQGNEFRKLYREAVSRVRELPNCLSSYSSPEAILEAFTVDYQTSDEFAFISTTEGGEEEVFYVHGVISETRLPPVLKGNRVSMGGLVQMVKLIAINDDQDFCAAVSAISSLCDFFQQSVGSYIQVPYAVQHGTSREITCVN
ncbi:hypothetical protein IW261DRAFT_1426665 [Armillaria novae-zelandiae]|uniref:Uncharacterized protein n=1 Tax=Armillaria novae-zelandiae TaxID=153914 RepID=A0AA39NKL7_9AGAR|nr:hypothetical protein IW261DRAFT_1426665 [Armillaria novae-zelandiae]